VNLLAQDKIDHFLVGWMLLVISFLFFKNVPLIFYNPSLVLNMFCSYVVVFEIAVLKEIWDRVKKPTRTHKEAPLDVLMTMAGAVIGLVVCFYFG
jgi:hypothetical protein